MNLNEYINPASFIYSLISNLYFSPKFNDFSISLSSTSNITSYPILFFGKYNYMIFIYIFIDYINIVFNYFY